MMETTKMTFFQKLHIVNKTLQNILILGVLLIIGAGYWWFSSMFHTKTIKESTISMNNWTMLAKQKVIVGELNAHATGTYGYKQVIESNLPFIGHRSDTLGWSAPGSRSVEIDGPIRADIGYDMEHGGKLFSDDAQGILLETKDTVYLTVKTHYPEPQALNIQIRTIPKKSNSLFSGKISDDEFVTYTDSAGKTASNEIVHEKKDQFFNAYSNCIGILLYQTGTMMAHGKPFVLNLYVNDKSFVPGKQEPVVIKDPIPLGKTMYQ